MTQATIESVKERQDELAALITKLEEQLSKPKYFEYQGERIPLNPGETYIGTITTPGNNGSYHLILMPDACEPVTWNKAMEWADERGGKLPNRVDGALLFATQKAEFKKSLHWTSESDFGSTAWVQVFDLGNQYELLKNYYCCARAVRRLPI